jgi:hypothetical protein
MTADFVPFHVSKASAERTNAEPPTAIITGANCTPAFTPLTQLGSPAATLPSPHGEPQVILERERDHVKYIKVHCPCGNVIELACEY